MAPVMSLQKLTIFMTLFGSAVATIQELEVSQVIKEVLSGPLRDSKVAFVVEEDLEKTLDVGKILKAVSEPAYYLRLFQDSCGAEEEDCYEYPLTSNGVVIAIVESYTWWPLWSPPENWSPRGVLLFSTAVSLSCKAEAFLNTPLLSRTESVALLCPQFQNESWKNLSYTLLTWLPFASSKKLWRVGDWDLSVFTSFERLFPDRFSDFHGNEVTIAYNADDQPLLFQREDGQFDGTNYRMLQLLARWLNFSYSFTSDPLWGERNANGTWTGILGYLHRGEKDLVLNYITLTPDRVEDFDISVTYHSEGFGIMLKVPPPLPRWQNVIFPFSTELWAAVVLGLILTGIFFHLFNRRFENSFSKNFLMVFQCLVLKSLDSIPENWDVRCFLGSWFFSSWILSVSYTCNLIAVLTVPVYPKRIETKEEIAGSDLRMCMVDYGEFVPEALAVSTDVTLSALGAKMDLVPIVEPLPYMGEEGCISLVLEGTHAHTETYAYMEIMYSDLGHGEYVYSLRKQLYEGNLAFVFKKGTPWRYKFNLGIQSLVEAGLVEKWYRDLMSEFEKGSREGGLIELQPLSVGHLQGPFLLLLTGLVMAFLVLAGEYSIHASKKAN
ncbi:glutamate receptor ionotropic, kainate glr-3-like [Palaemon carinicauda]|uniref:glutamate receptor ionotropic, kainate glr-3-like n=1 Tax=Palaemon carinicauda TaxID=392227 RepID=UPI0035B69D5D